MSQKRSAVTCYGNFAGGFGKGVFCAPGDWREFCCRFSQSISAERLISLPASGMRRAGDEVLATAMACA